MKLSTLITQNIVRHLLAGEDYRADIVTLIDAEFLKYAVEFFKRVAYAKLDNQTITSDWYKKELLSPDLDKEELAIHSGLNMKTISNMYNSATKSIVLEASLEHYDALYKAIELLVLEGDIDISLTIQFRAVSVQLNISESLIVINTLAVKRSALRGGLWSTAGKQVEKPLMRTLCALLRVPRKYFDVIDAPKSSREIDFYLIDGKKEYRKCEVKLMGKGNPESADGALAKDTSVFVADKLSNSNKRHLDEREIHWVELRGSDALQQFAEVLQKMDIPHKPFKGSLKTALERVFAVVFPDEESDSSKTSLVKESRSTFYGEELLVDW
ncbi:MAG: CfrBI family restriction endonuclease [Armatimonadetes bacterium]|nr:CfrBI family restriction endonuclease [Armatimonadota bacterium]